MEPKCKILDCRGDNRLVGCDAVRSIRYAWTDMSQDPDASIFRFITEFMGTAVAQWLRCCATNRKVAGSIPADVTGIFHCGPGVDSVSNRNEYQEHFLGVKAAGA